MGNQLSTQSQSGNRGGLPPTKTFEQLMAIPASQLSMSELKDLNQFLDEDLAANKQQRDETDKLAELAAEVDAKRLAWTSYRQGRSSKSYSTHSGGLGSSSSQSSSSSSSSSSQLLSPSSPAGQGNAGGGNTSGVNNNVNSGNSNIFVGGSILSGSESSRATRLVDPDGRCYFTFDSKTVLDRVRETLPFRRMCVHERTARYLGPDGLKLESEKVLSVVREMSAVCITFLGSGHVPGDLDKWQSCVMFRELHGLSVFKTAEFERFCKFSFGGDGVLSLRSFLPVSLVRVPWSLQSLLLAVENLQNVMCVVYGAIWVDVFQLLLNEVKLNGAQVAGMRTKNAGFLAHAIEIQLAVLSFILAGEWSPSLAAHYGVDTMVSTQHVRCVVQAVMLQTNVSTEAYLMWGDIRGKDEGVGHGGGSKKTEADGEDLGGKSGGKQRTRKRSRGGDKKDSSVVSDKGAEKAEEKVEGEGKRGKQERPSVSFKEDSSGSQSPMRQRLCFNSFLGSIGIRGYGKEKCEVVGCPHKHGYDPKRKSEYIKLAKSPRLLVDEGIRQMVVDTAEGLRE